MRAPEEVVSDKTIAYHISEILTALGYDPRDQHFLETPQRVERALRLYARNHDDDAASRHLDAVFSDAHDSMVIVGPIRVTSMCAHHMLPVRGNAWVGYIPDERVCGLSKLARIVHHYAKQLTVQERVTQQVVELIDTHLAPRGVMVVIEAEHGCMSTRGVEEPEAQTVTSAFRGEFRDAAARDEFLSLIGRRR